MAMVRFLRRAASNPAPLAALGVRAHPGPADGRSGGSVARRRRAHRLHGRRLADRGEAHGAAGTRRARIRRAASWARSPRAPGTGRLPGVPRAIPGRPRAQRRSQREEGLDVGARTVHASDVAPSRSRPERAAPARPPLRVSSPPTRVTRNATPRMPREHGDTVGCPPSTRGTVQVEVATRECRSKRDGRGASAGSGGAR